MLCQHCNTNPAVYHFHMAFGPRVSRFHLCEECAETLNRWYQTLSAGAAPANPWTESVPADRIPSAVDEDFSGRSQLGELRSRLEEAVAAEEYETAAQLRDEIRRIGNAMVRQPETKEKLV